MRRSGTARTDDPLDREDGPVSKVPPLEAGDCLTRAEFEVRYDATPGIRKAELVEGIVYMPSPTRYRSHSRPHGQLATWLSTYEAHTPGTEAADNGTVRLDQDNEPQPDVLLRIIDDRGGQSSTSRDDYIEGAPDLICEVASSSTSYDLHAKLHAYRRNGVREYLVVRTLDRAVDWFVLREGRFDRLEPGNDGLLRSTVFPGLWLDPAALLAGNIKLLLDVLARGLASEPHRMFVQELEDGAVPPG